MTYFSLHKSTFGRKTFTRWWWGLLNNKVFLFSLFVLSGSAVIGQTAPEIKPPVFDYVSINPASGDVTVQWKLSPSPGVTGYVIQEEEISGENKPIVTINDPNTTSQSFTFPKALTGPVHINVFAFDGADNQSLRTTPSHITIFVSSFYDSCNASILVKWTPYVGWGERLTGYSIFSAENNYLFTKVGEVSADINEFSVLNVEENKEYCYYISAIRNDGKTSLSNKVCLTTITPLPPSYITGNYTRYPSDNQLEIMFSIDPGVTKDLYRLYRSDPSGKSVLLTEVNKSADGTISYTDALPSLKVYDYKLVYLNQCGAEGKSSIPVNNILLTGKSEAMTNRLSWNSFSSWANGTETVKVYRTSSLGTDVLIADNLSANTTEYSDVITAQMQIEGDICYQVKAFSRPDPWGKVYISESNSFCVDMLGEIFVPNAFTPNGDGKNDIFKPSFSIIPQKYSFIIYNRYGFKIFETSDSSQGWDGRLSDGTKTPEGGYIYYVRIENDKGKVLEKRGNFTTIYP